MCYIYPNPLNMPNPAVDPYYTNGTTGYNKAYDATDAIIRGNLEAIRRFERTLAEKGLSSQDCSQMTPQQMLDHEHLHGNPLKGLPTRTKPSPQTTP